MSVRLNRSVRPYLKRKKILSDDSEPCPKFSMRSAHPHARPVTPAERLRTPDSPGTKVTTEE